MKNVIIIGVGDSISTIQAAEFKRRGFDIIQEDDKEAIQEFLKSEVVNLPIDIKNIHDSNSLNIVVNTPYTAPKVQHHTPYKNKFTRGVRK